MTSLVERFGIGLDLVALVGGGGKSTLALTIGRELADTQRAVVITTTTKMGADQIPPWTRLCRDVAEAIEAIASGTPAFLVGSIEGPKVIGIEPGVASRIFSEHRVPVIVEADGARRRPFKAPGPHEPVIPVNATIVVVVAGADALDRPIGESCHRPERVAALTGRDTDALLRPEDVVTVVTSPDGGRKGVPAAARLVFALTKVGPDHRNSVDEIERRLPDDVEFVVIPTD